MNPFKKERQIIREWCVLSIKPKKCMFKFALHSYMNKPHEVQQVKKKLNIIRFSPEIQIQK